MKHFPLQPPKGVEKKERRFTEALRGIERRAAEGPVTIGELLTLCGPQGHGFLAIFLVLPFLQPIPLPGLSSAIGVLLMILGVFVALRRPPWLPRRLAQVSVEPDVVLRICSSLEKLLGALEHVVKPRAQWLFAQRWFRVSNGVVWIVHAALFSLPLPIPFSNALPAVVILLMALGILEEDLRVIVVAYVGGLVNLIYFSALVALPALGWQVLSH
ncbi:MAG: exopolysaccharide biosynthesis protein [Candidatus Binatia bacterium]